MESYLARVWAKERQLDHTKVTWRAFAVRAVGGGGPLFCTLLLPPAIAGILRILQIIWVLCEHMLLDGHGDVGKLSVWVLYVIGWKREPRHIKKRLGIRNRIWMVIIVSPLRPHIVAVYLRRVLPGLWGKKSGNDLPDPTGLGPGGRAPCRTFAHSKQ